MKALSSVLVAAVMLAAPSRSAAQVFGQVMGAEPVPVNGHLFGAYVHASQDFLGLLAQLRLSFYPDVDFGFHGGLSRAEFSGRDITMLGLGADLKWLVARANPVDLAVGGALGVETGDDVHFLAVGPTVVASRTLAIGARGGIIPYVGVGLLFTSAEIFGRETTDASLPFRFGAEFRLAPELRLVAELQLRASDAINDDISFVTGVNLPF